PLALVRNSTLPSASANRVWSLPRPTFCPGCHLVPRWRARMLPASTCSPPKIFKPRRWACESRPLREEPPAFLCAIAISPSVSGYVMHLGDEIITSFCQSLLCRHPYRQGRRAAPQRKRRRGGPPPPGAGGPRPGLQPIPNDRSALYRALLLLA